jgi:hypothetical protein
MLRRTFRLCLLLTASATFGCNPPPAAEPTTPPADAGAPATDTEAPVADAGGDAEAPAADLPEATEVLAKSIDAVGGKAAIDAIDSSYTESKTEIKAQGLTVATKVWSKGESFYVESDMPGMGLSQVWKKGDEIWSKDPINGMRKLEGKEAAQAMWSSDPVLAANWNKYFDKAQTVRFSKDGDRQLVEVELTGKDGEALTLLFDAETYMPAGQSFKQETPMGSMPIRITYSDFREVGGVKVAFKSVSDMQVVSAEQITEKYEVNVKVDDKKFNPPKK